MFGLVTAENAAGGIIITSGQFTLEATKFANGKQLAALIGTVQKGQKMAPVPVTTDTHGLLYQVSCYHSD